MKRDGTQWFFPAIQLQPAVPQASDIAEGMIRLSLKAEELREWASFLLAASSLVDLTQVEESPGGEELLKALWDISFGAPLDAKRARELHDLAT